MSKRSHRLQFTKEELASPEVKKAARKADKRVDKLEKAEAKIPKKTVKTKQRVVDPKNGKVTTRLFFEEKKKPPSMLRHAITDAPSVTVLNAVHREVRASEQDNVGVEAAHSIEQGAETGLRLGQGTYRSQKLKPYRNAVRAENKADRANLRALYRQSEQQNPQFAGNPYSRWQQKKAIRKEYAAAKAGSGASKTAKASETTAKAAKKTAEETKKTAAFIARHKKGFAIVGAIAACLLILVTNLSSCSTLLQGGTVGIAMSTYPSEDADILAAEAQYLGMEAALQAYLDSYESTHSYDEYHYDLDDIEHDPYVLISAITALMNAEPWTISEVQNILAMLFEQQYILTETVIVEQRYYIETDTWTETDPETGETTTYSESYRVYYDYYICTVELENFNLSHVPVYIMGETQLSLYAMYMSTLGNRPDLFPTSSYIGKYDGNYTMYEIPPEALEDEVFAAIITEAEKYLGYPYVWGGSSPSTSFDCSGFVSWVINHSGWDVGRLGAQGLLNICTRISAANAKPGDLIFFQGTYDTTGASHVGIYVGDGWMIHCGDPISYANINSSYWQSHFLAYGRLP